MIVTFRVTGAPLANDEMLIGGVLIEPLLAPPVTPPPTHALTGRTTMIVYGVSFVVRPGEIVIVPLGFAHVVPPAAFAGPAVNTAAWTISATAMVNRNTFLIQRLVAESRSPGPVVCATPRIGYSTPQSSKPCFFRLNGAACALRPRRMVLAHGAAS